MTRNRGRNRIGLNQYQFGNGRLDGQVLRMVILVINTDGAGIVRIAIFMKMHYGHDTGEKIDAHQ